MIRLSVAAGIALVGALAFSGAAQARPQYNKEIQAMYPDNKAVSEAKCAVCHPAMNKKERNDYGMALGKLVGGKDQKNADKINEGLKKAEGEKSAVDGKTFGDLLKDGKLPGKK